jgi:GNAT superfamily N-acetyltransferase
VIDVRQLGPEDASSLVACVRSCYGESYTEPEFYDAAYLRRELGTSRLLSIGAVADGRVVGHIGTRIVTPGDPVADTIAGIVHPDYRGRGLTAAMGAEMVARYRDRGIVGARHVATGAHDRTQRLIVASGGVVTGILLGHVASGTQYRGIPHQFGRARIGVVVYFQPYGPLAGLDVYVPTRYQFLRYLYRDLRVERRLVEAASTSTALDDWSGSIDHDRRRGISTLRFGASSIGTPRPATEVLRAARGHCEEVVYADLPLADARTPAAADWLHDEGFYLGALLPGSSTSETLRLQRIAAPLAAPEAIVTASDGGRALLERISREHREACGAGERRNRSG